MQPLILRTDNGILEIIMPCLEAENYGVIPGPIIKPEFQK